MMLLGQGLTLGSLLLMLGLGLAGVDTPLALALPLVILGVGHGLLAPPALAGTVGLVPALAGAAAAVAGLMQQLMGAAGGYVVGMFPHAGAVNLGWLMLAFAGCGAAAQVLLYRWSRQPVSRGGAR
jgi:DHA1 family bicyclomycin/chloramphenicol resistance-like MFS transporter